MNKLTLVAFLAFAGLGSAANAALSLESTQNVMRYMGSGPCPVAVASAAPCAAPCPCPIECPCTPVCCPANRGLFDGGMCCGGRAVPPICGC